MHQIEKINAIAEAIRLKTNDFKPEIAIILGSGLGELADSIQNPIVLPYEEIPDFPRSTVKGHAGQLIFGELEGKKVVAMKGRIHYYEGHGMTKTVLTH